MRVYVCICDCVCVCVYIHHKSQKNLKEHTIEKETIVEMYTNETLSSRITRRKDA